MKTSNLRYFLRFILCGLLLCLSPLANAAFITDKIVVEVRSERFGQGEILKTIPSGTSVEVLFVDGQYTRIRTNDNITGWVASTFVTKQKPTQLEYLELLGKSKTLEEKLKAAEEQLANADSDPSGGTSVGVSEQEIEELRKQASDARWMKVEMQKARDRAEQAEAKLKSTSKKSGDNQQELDDLKTKNKDLEQRLAAALLVNEQQAQMEPAQSEDELAPIPMISDQPEPTLASDEWSVGLSWFFGCVAVALIGGFILGIMWLDKRIRQRHGGFRIY